MMLCIYPKLLVIPDRRAPIKAPVSDKDEKGGVGEKYIRRGKRELYLQDKYLDDMNCSQVSRTMILSNL